jgi:signal transduction histidine kinase
MRDRSRRLRGLAIAVALSAAALVLSRANALLFGGAYLYFPLVAVLVSALYEGLVPGLIAVAVCTLGFDYLFIGPPLHLGVSTPEEAHRLAGFVVSGAAVSFIAGRFHAARRSAERARREAEAASAEARQMGELQERLVAVVSHDLRNPVGALRTGLDLLPRLGPLAERQSSVLERLRGTTDRMETLIRSVLDVARTRADAPLPLARAPAHLAEICARAVAEVEDAVPAAEVALTIEGDDAAELDGPRVAQLVTNLVANAVQHGAPGAPVAVRVRGVGPEVTLEVENRGEPIRREILPVLFEPFRRGSADGSGLGLGLFIVREIARAHGGAVAVRSSEAGTVFEVRLPRAAPH